MDKLAAAWQIQVSLARGIKPFRPTFNMTIDWLEAAGKHHLAKAVFDGVITGRAAFESAIDARSLSERLADWDKRRSLFKLSAGSQAATARSL